jgi:hypothetical protein
VLNAPFFIPYQQAAKQALFWSHETRFYMPKHGSREDFAKAASGLADEGRF